MADQLWLMKRIRQEEDSDNILCSIVGFMQIVQVLCIAMHDMYCRLFQHVSTQTIHSW